MSDNAFDDDSIAVPTAAVVDVFLFVVTMIVDAAVLF
jgi:hypothetical protein